MTDRLLLPTGETVYFDAADWGIISKFRWHRLKTPWTCYVITNVWHAELGRRTSLSMHRLLAGLPGMTVDHRDRDGLNNRRSNLRVASRIEQGHNRGAQSKRALIHSRFKGVCYHKQQRYWYAQIYLRDAKGVRRAVYRQAPTEDDAALWYNALALKHFGEFARLNEVA